MCFYVSEGEELGPQQEEGDVEIEEEKEEVCDDENILGDIPPPKATSRSVTINSLSSSYNVVETTRKFPQSSRVKTASSSNNLLLAFLLYLAPF